MKYQFMLSGGAKISLEVDGPIDNADWTQLQGVLRALRPSFQGPKAAASVTYAVESYGPAVPKEQLRKIRAIKAVRQFSGYGLVEAKRLVECGQVMMGAHYTYHEASQLVGELQACGYSAKMRIARPEEGSMR